MMEKSKWIERLFATIDAKNTDGFVGFLSENAEVRFGNGPSFRGQEEIFESIGEFFSAIAGLEHELANVWSVDGAVIVEGEVTYFRRDETRLTLPFCNVLHLADGEELKVARYYIYADQSELFAA